MNQKRRGALMLEEGWYRAAIEEDDGKTYDWGFGLNITFKILDGHFAGYRIFDFLCLEHSNEKTQKIARVRLRELAEAAGHPTPDQVDDTAPMYGRPVMVRVYRVEEKNRERAEADGKRPRVGEYLSTKRWKDERGDEPMPGVTEEINQPRAEEPKQRRLESVKPAAVSKPAGDWTMTADDIPF
jgi:hypothetical protein